MLSSKTNLVNTIHFIMFSFSDVDSGLLSMPATDVAMFNERFKKISEKILMTKLSQLSTQQTEALGSLLALK